MSDKLSIERLEKIAFGSVRQSQEEGVFIAREALAYREAESKPVAIVETSDRMTFAQLVGTEPRRKAIRELYEGGLVIGQKLYASPVLSQSVAWIPEVGERCKVYWVNGGHNTATITEMSKSSFRYLIDHNEYEMHLDRVHKFVSLPASTSPEISQQQAHSSALTPGIILECMQQQWDEWDTDTNSFPPDFSWRGGNGSLSFEASSWAVNVARSIMKYVESSSQSVAPERLPCNVLLEPGMRIGKGCKTETLFLALSRRAQYEVHKAAMTPEERESEAKVFAALMDQLGLKPRHPLQPFVPEGWALVPIKPTEAMLIASEISFAPQARSKRESI